MSSTRKKSAQFRVVMEGIPLNSSPEANGRITNMSPIKRENGVNTRLSEVQTLKVAPSARPFVPRTGMSPEGSPISMESPGGSSGPKPAILSRTGTVSAVPVMKDRKRPAEKISTLKQIALPVSTRIGQIPLETGTATLNSSPLSRIESPGNQLDVSYLMNEALEIGRKVDEQTKNYLTPPRPNQSKRGGAGRRAAKMTVSSDKTKDKSDVIASLYETEETRLVDSLILQLKQSAAGVLITDTDLKIRDVTKQIAESLGIAPEELDPELFHTTDPKLLLPISSQRSLTATPGAESEAGIPSTLADEAGLGIDTSFVISSEPGTDSILKMDHELSEIVKTMPEDSDIPRKTSRISFKNELSESREGVDSDTDIDDLNEIGQLASLPAEVTLADVLCIEGKQYKLGNLSSLEKDATTVETQDRLQKLMEEQPKKEDGRVHIHRLCFENVTSEGLLPNDLQQVAFEAHVNRRFNKHPDELTAERPSWYQAALQDLRRELGQDKNESNEHTGITFGNSRQHVPFVNVDDALFVPGLKERQWPSKNQHYSMKKDISNIKPDGIAGANMQIYEPNDPKFPNFSAGPSLLGLTPQEARKQLFPNFESAADAREDDYLLVELDGRFGPSGNKAAPFENFMLKMARSSTSILTRLISKDDTNLMPRFQRRLPIKSSLPNRNYKRESDGLFLPNRRRTQAAVADGGTQPRVQSPGRPLMHFQERKGLSASLSKLNTLLTQYGGTSEPTVRIKQDYKVAITEVNLHKEMCKEIAARNKEERDRETAARTAEEERRKALDSAGQIPDVVISEEMLEDGTGMQFNFDGTILSQIETVEQTRKIQLPTEAELALWSVRPGVTRKLSKPMKVRRLDSDKMTWVKQHLVEKPPTRRSRRLSCPPGITKEYKKHVWPFGPRSQSPDAILNFEEYGRKNGLKSTDNPREWVRGIWEIWFDEVIPPLEAFSGAGVSKAPPVDTTAALAESLAVLMNTEKRAAEVIEEATEVVITNEIFDIDIPLPEDTPENEFEREKIFILQEEIEKLSELLDKPLKLITKAITLTRRGAILRKLGKLVSALADLNAALELIPTFVDALWHRHFIYLVENKIPSAISDLNLIVRIYRFHAGAYMSRAAIYTEREDILEAIDDYSMAIRSSPANAEAYFLRAKLYERKGEPLLAMEDYMRANQLMPHDTTALLCHARHYIKTKNYPVAIQDLTQILERQPSRPDMYLLRGQCLVEQNRYELACADFSAAIYLDPNNPEPYFQRGCLNRTLYAERALMDFSISLMLDYSEKNIRSLLHRGILYFELGLDHEAEGDFEAILRLDRDHPAAHTNLGRIYLNKRLDFTRAIRRFTTAIRADPTYRPAYLCRAEAYTKVKNWHEAVRDFTKAIHLQPSDYTVYVHRGAAVLATGNNQAAAFCIRQATEAQQDQGPGSAVYQKAFVQAFLKRFDKAIEILQGSLRNVYSSSQGMIVLGKIYMKARNFSQAAECFNNAINLMRPKREVLAAKWPEETPNIYYLLGRCFLNMRKWSQALESFNDAIKTKPDFAEAYYRRGVVRFALKHQKAIEDIHRALAIDPKIFEAYLTRAVFFAQKKLWPLAIVNCNETIKIVPRCIRAYVYRGAFKFFNHNYKGAVDDLNEACKIDRNSVLALFNRACSHQHADCVKMALRDYSAILLVESQRGTSRLSYQTYVNRGLLYFSRRDYANALADFRNAALMKPHDPHLVHALALCYHKQNLLKRSVLTYSKLLTDHKHFVDGYIGRANALVDYNTPEAKAYAIKEFQRRLIINPQLQTARINLAICLQMAGKLHQAYRQLTIVTSMMERQPNTAPIMLARARELRGVVSLQAKSFAAAHQDLSAAARIRPSAAILNNRAVCNLLMNCREAAVKDFREALHMDQRFSVGYFNLANVFMFNKRWEQAKDFYDRAILFGPDNETALINRAVVLTRLGDLAGAFHDLASARPLSPHAHHIAYNRAVLHRMVKKVEAAFADIEQAVRLKPDDPDLYKFRGLIRSDLGETEKSLEDYSYSIDLRNFLKELQDAKENSTLSLPKKQNDTQKQIVPTM